MKLNKNVVSEHLITKLFGSGLINEDNSNPVVNNDTYNKVSDFIQYTNKPGIIVAIIKGEDDSSCGVQQLPVGAVDNFRFMKVNDESAIQRYKDLANETEDGKSYEQILKEYESTKNNIINEWKKKNTMAFEALSNKYGDKLVGMDIVQNDKKLQHKEEDKDEKKERKFGEYEREEKEISNKEEILEEDEINEGFIAKFKQWYGDRKANKETIELLKKNGPQGISKFSEQLIAVSENIEQMKKTFIKIRYDEKDYDVVISKEQENNPKYTIAKFDGIKSLILMYDDSNLTESIKLTVEKFDQILAANDVNSMTRDIKGILVLPTSNVGFQSREEIDATTGARTTKTKARSISDEKLTSKNLQAHALVVNDASMPNEKTILLESTFGTVDTKRTASRAKMRFS